MLPQEIAPPQTDESPVIIETHDLSRIYPGVVALDNVNYRVYRNKVNVLIGENGAGKSTMMKMLAGGEKPSSGYRFSEYRHAAHERAGGPGNLP